MISFEDGTEATAEVAEPVVLLIFTDDDDDDNEEDDKDRAFAVGLSFADIVVR